MDLKVGGRQKKGQESSLSHLEATGHTLEGRQTKAGREQSKTDSHVVGGGGDKNTNRSSTENLAQKGEGVWLKQAQGQEKNKIQVKIIRYLKVKLKKYTKT